METTYFCTKCLKEVDPDEHECKEIVKVCAYCLGSGQVPSMEQVYPGEPHYANTGVQPCICVETKQDE